MNMPDKHRVTSSPLIRRLRILVLPLQITGRRIVHEILRLLRWPTKGERTPDHISQGDSRNPRPRMLRRIDGSPRCTACLACAAACPTDCIHIIPMHTSADPWSGRPQSFQFRLQDCLACGLCVEVCLFDALVFVGRDASRSSGPLVSSELDLPALLGDGA
jgi:ferredoxin